MMALKLSPIAFHFRSQKLPSFALPQMASLASPKFVMPSTLSASKACPKMLFAVCALSSEIAGISTSEFEDFSVTTSGTGKTNELKVSIEVSGAKTRVIFDDVFSKMVADAQPIPGFRRVKGGKTPNVSSFNSNFH
ncbi:uncharacterized protein LOC127811411 [Diospyros lotus]|uniref:uncharacterized protein LOC127811411 n=1 Tax=Diospyros lotus TaxID=55363 RepID=UPI0022503645|nr:uncharacterized protein LOC127811411 [Diospyros lotus]